jgi:inosine-uridine nucleoside N-ribohydrolase
MMRIHVDTDLGGDPDDVCALALLLGWPDVEIVGITTTIDPGGGRAARVRHLLELVGRGDVPVVAGAEVSATAGKIARPYEGESYWPASLQACPAPDGAAVDLLSSSAANGATIVTLGPLTNLAALALSNPKLLEEVPIVASGGWTRPPIEGLPPWGPDQDWNMQWDAGAAKTAALIARNMTLVTLPAQLKAQLRQAHLPRLRASGALGELLARQSEAWAVDHGMTTLRQYPGVSDDLLNFHYDPVACAVAVGWNGVVTEEIGLAPVVEGNLLLWALDDCGRSPRRVVVDVDGEGFDEIWLAAVEQAQGFS